MVISNSDCSSATKKNKRLRGGQPPGVHNTNFYEVEGQVRTNPAAGIELEDAAYDVVQVGSAMTWYPLRHEINSSSCFRIEEPNLREYIQKV